MISHTSLLIMSLAPVVAYFAGALVFSLIGLVQKSAICRRSNAFFNYRNGL